MLDRWHSSKDWSLGKGGLSKDIIVETVFLRLVGGACLIYFLSLLQLLRPCVRALLSSLPAPGPGPSWQLALT